MTAPLTLATYNVHGCVGADGRHDPGRVAAVLAELDADVVALQELAWQPDAALNLLHDLARRLGCHSIAGPTLLRRAGHYGNALLTRWPADAVTRIDLSLAGREPRGALDVRLHAPATDLRVVATHLGLSPRERRLQTKAQVAALGPPLDTAAAFDVTAGPGAGPHPRTPVTVLLGDLNEWFLWGRPLRRLHRHFGATPAPATFPARWPVLALDRIWVEPRARLLQLRRHRTALARQASDHLPLVAQIQG